MSWCRYAANSWLVQNRKVPYAQINFGGEGIFAAKVLMVLSASITFTLGVVHLVYTFWGTNLTPRDPALQISMSQIAPVITKETTM